MRRRTGHAKKAGARPGFMPFLAAVHGVPGTGQARLDRRAGALA